MKLAAYYRHQKSLHLFSENLGRLKALYEERERERHGERLKRKTVRERERGRKREKREMRERKTE